MNCSRGCNLENVNTTQSEVIAPPPLALPDALVVAENCRTMVENGNRRRVRFYLQNRITV
jgi:hypothetical protein